MMKFVVIGVGVAGLLLLTGGEGRARSYVHPWCEISSADAFTHCDFDTFEQCRAFAVGDGVCENNPWYRPAAVVRAPRYRAHKRPRHR